MRPKYEKFCREYIKAEFTGIKGPGTYAARAIGVKDGNDFNATRYASRLMATNDKVRQRIDELRDAAFSIDDITPEYLIKAMAEEAATAEHSRDKQSALKTLMQCKGMLINKREDVTHKDENILEALTELFGQDVATEAARRLGYEVKGDAETLQ